MYNDYREKIVKSILFDVMYKGKTYKDLELGYHGDPNVTKNYIYDEDGPWGMVEVGDDIIDFQIYADPDFPDILKMAACKMEWDEKGNYYSHTDFLGSEDIDISNIRVEYCD